MLVEQKKFCFVNSKSARKKLVDALFNVPRQALDLLPMYARLVAILDKVHSRHEGEGGDGGYRDLDAPFNHAVCFTTTVILEHRKVLT